MGEFTAECLGEVTAESSTEDCVLATTINTFRSRDEHQPCTMLCDCPPGTVQQMVGLGSDGKTLHTHCPAGKVLEQNDGPWITVKTKNTKILEKRGGQNKDTKVLDKRGAGRHDGDSIQGDKTKYPRTTADHADLPPTDRRPHRPPTTTPARPTVAECPQDPRNLSGGMPSSCSGGMPPDPRKSSGGMPTSQEQRALTTTAPTTAAGEAAEEDSGDQGEEAAEEDSENRGPNIR